MKKIQEILSGVGKPTPKSKEKFIAFIIGTVCFLLSLSYGVIVLIQVLSKRN